MFFYLSSIRKYSDNSRRSPNLHHAVSAKTPHGLPHPARGFHHCFFARLAASRALAGLPYAFRATVVTRSVTHSTFDLTRLATSLPEVATPPNQRPKSVTYQTILVNLDAVQLCKHHPQGSLLGFMEEKRVKSFHYVLHTRFDGSQASQP